MPLVKYPNASPLVILAFPAVSSVVLIMYTILDKLGASVNPFFHFFLTLSQIVDYHIIMIFPRRFLQLPALQQLGKENPPPHRGEGLNDTI